jgi:delta-aminolevulinic acid dehydratase/porphobilinogen synthase
MQQGHFGTVDGRNIASFSYTSIFQQENETMAFHVKGANPAPPSSMLTGNIASMRKGVLPRATQH